MRVRLPHPARRNPARRAGELDELRPGDAAAASAGEVERRPGDDRRRCARRRARSCARGRRSRSAPRALGGSALEVGAERDRELERLAAIAQVASPSAGSSPAVVERARRTSGRVSRRSSLATRPSAERTPAASGTSTVAQPSSSASAQACSGPRRRRRRARTRADRGRARPRRRAGRAASPRSTTSTTAAGSIPPSARAAASASSSSPPGSRRGRRPRRRFASVTVGSAPPRP